MNKEEYLKNWSDKLSLTVEQIEQEYQALFEEEKQIHKDLSPEEQEQRALQRLALTYKKQLRSPAVGFEGVIIGTADCIDIVAKQRREAKELFKTDPQTAVSEGVTDEEGIPLDTREVWRNGKTNYSFGKPLPEHNYLRNVYGVVKKTKGADEPKFFSMVISGERAEDETIPVFAPLKFMAIDKSGYDETEYKLNASTFTTFTDNETLAIPALKDLLYTYTPPVAITDLERYHNDNKEEFNRLCVVEGDVSALNLEPTAFGSRVMSLEDPSSTLEDLDAKGVTCWVPERINLDFAEGSRVLVVGRTDQRKKKDDQRNPTEELGDVTMNVFGVYAIPEYKISLPEEIQPIAEEDI